MNNITISLETSKVIPRSFNKIEVLVEFKINLYKTSPKYNLEISLTISGRVEITSNE